MVNEMVNKEGLSKRRLVTLRCDRPQRKPQGLFRLLGSIVSQLVIPVTGFKTDNNPSSEGEEEGPAVGAASQASLRVRTCREAAVWTPGLLYCFAVFQLEVFKY